MTDVVVPFALVAALMTLSPGADSMLVLAAGVRSGARAARATAAGVNLGLLCWAAASTAGLAAVISSSDIAYRALQVAGGLVLLVIGMRTLRSGRARAAARGTTASGVRRRPSGAAADFRSGLLTNLLNPKVGVFYVSLLPQFVPSRDPSAGMLALLASIHLVFSVCWLMLLAQGAARAGAVVSARTLRLIESTAGAVFVLLGVRVATLG